MSGYTGGTGFGRVLLMVVGGLTAWFALLIGVLQVLTALAGQ